MSALPIAERLAPGISPVDVFERLSRLPGAAWLDSAAPAGGLGRFTFLASDPYRIVEAGSTDPGDPLERLREALGPPIRAEAPVPGPFAGGAIGFLSYDLGRRYETVPSIARDDLAMPDLRFGLYDVFVAFDATDAPGWIISTGAPEDGVAASRRARDRLAWLREILAGPKPPPGPWRCGEPVSSQSRDGYASDVRRALDWIREGHVYQVNLSQRFDAAFAGDPAGAYLALRAANPAPFAAYIDAGAHQILSSSPERFLAVGGGRVEIRPIKGTARRDPDPSVDRGLAEGLLASVKDRAELTMIVDLCRNDLGRVCSYGSVRADAFPRLESYATVHHLVATVSGWLREGADAFDAVRAAFPAGSITGAPKIRAMEIIEEIEPTRRGVYCGSIGWIGRDGRMDLNVAIRTMVIREGRLHFQVGGGIVADSNPHAEYEETLHKAEGMRRALLLAALDGAALHARAAGPR